MVIERRTGGATAKRRASSCSEIRRRRWLSSRSFRTRVSVPRRKGVLSMYSRPTAQFIMWRRISIVRLIDAGARTRGVLRRPAMRAFLKSAMKSSTSAVRI